MSQAVIIKKIIIIVFVRLLKIMVIIVIIIINIIFVIIIFIIFIIVRLLKKIVVIEKDCDKINSVVIQLRFLGQFIFL